MKYRYEVAEAYEIEYDEEYLVKLLNDRQLKITTAESCTGGMISSTIVNVSGASNVLDEAYVTYANEAKMKLVGVNEKTLKEYGAVSKETAFEMAKGVARAAKADTAIAVTGIAGPDGGTKEKPVGTVYAGFYVKGEVKVIKYHFDGDRYEVRRNATRAAISKISQLILASDS